MAIVLNLGNSNKQQADKMLRTKWGSRNRKRNRLDAFNADQRFESREDLNCSHTCNGEKMLDTPLGRLHAERTARLACCEAMVRQQCSDYSLTGRSSVTWVDGRLIVRSRKQALPPEANIVRTTKNAVEWSLPAFYEASVARVLAWRAKV